MGAGTNFQASTNFQTNRDFSYTGGANAPTAGSYDDVNGVFSNLLASKGSGIGLTVALPTTGTYQIFLWAGGFSLADGQLTASITGASASVSSGLTDDNTGPKDMYLYTITAQADTANDVVTLSLINNDAAPNNNSHVLIAAASVQLVPEPSALLLASLGALALLRRKR